MSSSAVSFAPRKITKNGQIVLPKAVRVALGVGNGDYVSFNIIDGTVVLTKEPVSADVVSGRSLPETEISDLPDMGARSAPAIAEV